MSINLLKLRKAYSRIRPFVINTEVLSGTYLDEKYDAQFFIKSEQFQPIGAFKIRGAANFFLQLSADQRSKGVVTHSSGNHAQAIAYMANKLLVKATVVMPENSNTVKIRNAKKWGATVVLCKPTIEDRLAVSNAIAEESGAVIIPPFDHEWIIEGQATAAMELLAEHSDLDYLITPLGGGGLLSGSALAAHFLSTNMQVIGAEPENASDGFEGFKSGMRVESFVPNTVADGLRTTVGKIPFEIIKENVKDIWLAREENIIPAMYEYWSETKQVIEPSCVVPFVALAGHEEEIKGKKIGVIVTGGNVDFKTLSR